MTPRVAVAVLQWGLLAEIAAMVGLVLYRFLTGAVATRGLLAAEADGDASPERVLLLIAVVGTVASYAASALHDAHLKHYAITSLPDVPDQFSALIYSALGGGQSIYIVTKAARRIWGDEQEERDR